MKDYNHNAKDLDRACGFASKRVSELTTMLAKELSCQSNRSRMIQYIEDMAKKYPEFQRFVSYHTLYRIESLLDGFIKEISKEKRRK